MILSGGDLGGQEVDGTFTIGEQITIDGYVYRVTSETQAVFTALTEPAINP